MTDEAERLRRVRELFDMVMEQPAEERAACLDRLTIGDPALRLEVRELIDSADQTQSPIDPPGAPADHLVGTRLGPYDIVRTLGRGGMGAVYEAVRADDQYRKRVAIKVVAGGLDSDLTVARFRRERQILANLQHPNIATLLDGGVTPDGRPFLVMEYIEGEPLTSWCDDHHLTIDQRIALFDQVCDAVQHAHASLIVHGDIKPGNILVTADGTAKLLDFGIAKLVGADAGDEAMPLTRGASRPFTPEYASPEQIRGQPLTTASDVYSLGVVLFEVTTGRRPHAPASPALMDVMQAVLNEPIPRPSAVATEARLRRSLRGELDNIMLTALRAEPERRYASVAALGADLRRYLTGMPVEAQGDWLGYRLRKFVQRNRAMVAVLAMLIVVLVGGVITTIAQARRARAAQTRAERVNDFLRTLLSSVQPTTAGRDVPVSEVLDSAARRIATELAAQPDVRSDLESVIGDSYLSLGRYDDADRHFRSALALHTQVDGPRSIPVVIALRNLVDLDLARGEMGPADSLIQQALALRRSLSSTADTLLASLLDDAGTVAHDQGRMSEAERLHREALDLYRTLLGPRADKVGETMSNVAVALGEQDRWAESVTLERGALEILTANHPEPNVAVANAKNALATALDIQGKSAAADSAYRDVLALRKKLYGPEHPQVAFTEFNYGFFLFTVGRYSDAADVSRQILALRGRTLPESHPAVAGSLQTLGRCLDHLGDTTAGRKSLEESLALRRQYLPAESWLIASSEGILADHDTLTKQYAKAERLALDASGIYLHALGPAHPKTQASYQRLIALYTTWHRPAKAAEYQAKLMPPHS